MTSRFLLIAAMLACALPAATDPPIACNLKGLTAGERKQLETVGGHVIAAIVSSRELPDGYAFKVDPAKASVVDVAQWLDVWRRCCPFYEFRIDMRAADATTWLEVKGRKGVKEYIPIDSPRLGAKLPK